MEGDDPRKMDCRQALGDGYRLTFRASTRDPEFKVRTQALIAGASRVFDAEDDDKQHAQPFG